MSLMVKINQRGFTLIEVLVTVGIFLLIGGAITEIMLVSFRDKNVVWEQLSTQNEGRQVVQDFVSELRVASASSIGAYPLETATTNTVIFYSNIDSDSWRERVRYFLSGTTLKKGVTKPTGNPLAYNTAGEVITDIAHDVANGTSSIFYYYDENYTGPSSIALTYPISVTAVRVVGIKLRMEEDPHLSPAPFTIEAKVSMRNLKSN